MRKLLVVLVALSAVTTMTQTLVAADTGKWFVASQADIAALSTMLHKEQPDSKAMGVHVVGDYGLVVWGEPHICCPSAVFKRDSGEQWTHIAGSAGDSPLGMSSLTQNGVPTSIARELCSGWPQGYGPC